ncbi:UNVERIFIED_CONTAM: hypothetical protein FKN15_039920 [Acipenser sinensis]
MEKTSSTWMTCWYMILQNRPQHHAESASPSDRGWTQAVPGQVPLPATGGHIPGPPGQRTGNQYIARQGDCCSGVAPPPLTNGDSEGSSVWPPTIAALSRTSPALLLPCTSCCARENPLNGRRNGMLRLTPSGRH